MQYQVSNCCINETGTLQYSLEGGTLELLVNETVAVARTITVTEVCTATSSAVAPAVTLGAATITVAEVCTGTAAAVAPTVTISAVTITVAEVCLGTATAVAPSVTLGAATITVSQVCLATATAIAPDVLQPIGIPGVEYRVAADRLHYNTTEE